MADAGGPGTLCAVFQGTVARYPAQVALRTPGGAVGDSAHSVIGGGSPA
jgi:hypothetical protein